MAIALVFCNRHEAHLPPLSQGDFWGRNCRIILAIRTWLISQEAVKIFQGLLFGFLIQKQGVIEGEGRAAVSMVDGAFQEIFLDKVCFGKNNHSAGERRGIVRKMG